MKAPPKSARKTCRVKRRRGLRALWRRLGPVGLLLLASLFCQAQAPIKVEGIDIQHVGPPAVSDQLVRANIRVKVGDAYSPAATDDDVRNLKATGYFRNAQVFAETRPGGVRLIYRVQGQPVVTEIRVEGNEKYSAKKLLKKATSKVGESLDEYKVFRDAQEMQKIYEKAGYQKTRVVPNVVVNESLGRSTVTFEVQESPKVRIADVVFDGAEAFSQSKLRRQIKTRRWWWLSWLTGSGKLKEEQFDEDLEKLKDFYRNEGYIDFDIREIKYEEIKPGRMVIRFVVYEGTRYKVGSVEFKGNEKFTAEQIRGGKVVLGAHVRPRMLEGQIFTPKGLDRDIEAIQDFYGSYGYIGKGDSDRIRILAIRNANVERGTIDLVYQVEEGDKSYIEKIDIRGNTKTKDRVIRRELAVAPGEVFDMVKVKRSAERLRGLQFFDKVGTEVEPTEARDRKNLIVGVEEGRSGNFYFGAGFSSIDKLFGYVGMTQGNFDLFNPPYFTGGGQKLRLQATVGTEQENYEIIFIEPWFLGRKLSFEVDLYHRDIQYYSDLYDQTETGAKFEWTKAIFTDQFRVGWNYTIENIGIDFDDSLKTVPTVVTEGPGRGRTGLIGTPQVSPELLAEEGDRLVSKIGTFFIYDTRGGGFLPNRGQRSQISAYVAGGPLGGDTDTYSLEFESAWYFRGLAPGHILEVGGRIGVVDFYGDTDHVPLFDRYFLGGAYTLRGYDYRDVGPKDPYNNPIGGSTYWFGSVEYSIPIIERLRFAMFYDVGMVYAQPYSFDPEPFPTGPYNDNWGVGLRLNIPQLGPMRLDYGVPIRSGDNGQSGEFQFSVGWIRPF